MGKDVRKKSRIFITREEVQAWLRSSKDRLTLLFGANAAVTFKPVLIYLSGSPRAFRDHAKSTLCSGDGTKPGRQHICLQQGLLDILNTLLTAAAQKKESFQSLTARKRQGKVTPESLWREHGSTDTLISNFQPPELCNNTFLLF